MKNRDKHCIEKVHGQYWCLLSCWILNESIFDVLVAGFTLHFLAFTGFYQMYNTILIFPDAILTLFHLVKISSISSKHKNTLTHAGDSLCLREREIYNIDSPHRYDSYSPPSYKRSNEMIPLWFQFLCNIYTFLCEKWKRKRKRNKNNTRIYTRYEMYLEFIATNCKLPSTVTCTILTVTGYARLKKEVTLEAK